MVNAPDSEVPLLLHLTEVVARVRQAMPMDRDVQEICYALRVVLDLQPRKDQKQAERHKRKIKKFEQAWRKGEKREYSRRWMAERRATARQIKPPRPVGRPRKQPEPEALP